MVLTCSCTPRLPLVSCRSRCWQTSSSRCPLSSLASAASTSHNNQLYIYICIYIYIYIYIYTYYISRCTLAYMNTHTHSHTHTHKHTDWHRLCRHHTAISTQTIIHLASTNVYTNTRESDTASDREYTRECVVFIDIQARPSYYGGAFILSTLSCVRKT